eukprot:TRINITY_DN2654_c0_g2_i3.p1 TRINITY_DN2654_c0_g2~~TRINITY_DN2654_c0_g2_i3.p1  ORF type:complete len:406 (+),score=117.84 TRINITY_DN2654_c0_g2_i3:51-1268(+)
MCVMPALVSRMACGESPTGAKAMLDDDRSVSSGASSEGEPHALQEKGASPLLQTCISTPSPSCATFADGEGRERLKHLLETVSASAEECDPGWCNFLYSTCCPFSHRHATGNAEKCRFLHLDTYFQMDVEARQAVGTMPNIMHKHMHGLVRDMARALNSRARAVLEAHVVSSVWNNGEGNEAECTVNPYEETVEMLRSLGWVIPPQEPSAVFAQSMKLEDAPYAGDVAAIVQLCARCVHYQVNSVDDVIVKMIAWVFGSGHALVGRWRMNVSFNEDMMDLVADENVTPGDDSAIAALSDKHWNVRFTTETASAAAPAVTEMSDRQRRRAAYVAKQREKQSAAKALRRARAAGRAPQAPPASVGEPVLHEGHAVASGDGNFMAMAQHHIRCLAPQRASVPTSTCAP